MSFLRDTINDLIDRRLWPVAVALLAALVAVPLVLARGGEPEGGQPPTVASTAARDVAGLEPVVTAGQEDPSAKRHRRGRARDPFVQQHVPKPDKSTVTAQGPLGPGQTPSSGGGSTSTGSTGPGGSTGPSTPPAATEPTGDEDSGKKRYETYSVDIRFGEAGARTERRNLPRLAALPSSEDPLLIYLGLLKDGKTAVFLVSSDAAAQGDGECKPNPTDCETIHLKKGDTEFFDVTLEDGAVVQYQLDLLRIVKHTTTSKSKAARAYARESRAGRRALRGAVVRASSMGRLRYSRRTGRLYYSPVLAVPPIMGGSATPPLAEVVPAEPVPPAETSGP